MSHPITLTFISQPYRGVTILKKSRKIWRATLTVSLVLLFVSVPQGNTRAAAQPQASASSFQQQQTFYGGYRTVEGMQAFLDNQVLAHPTLAEKVDFGDSWCKSHSPCTQPEPGYDGYDLYALRITNRGIPGPKPVFWFDAGMHANEMVPPELAMRFISWLLDGYSLNADARWLVDYHDIWVVPMVNPDAHHIVEAGGDTPYLQRKNANNSNGCTVYPPSPTGVMFGTDLNRNFPFKWACCEGSSNDPCFQLYRGPSPASEPETQAVISQLRSLIPDQRGPNDSDPAPLTAMGVAQSMHSILKINFYPWAFSSQPAPNRADLESIASHMSEPETMGNGYKSCQAGICGGRLDGGTLDWVYGELGAVGLTTEIGGSAFAIPYGEVEAIWNDNRQALIYQAKIARTPYLLARGPDAHSLAVEPKVVNAGSAPRLSATVNYAWFGNQYRQNVGAAEYYIDTPPWAGGTPRKMDPTDGKLDSQTEVLQSSIDTNGLAPGRHIIFVRGRGSRTYEGHADWGPVSAIFLDVVQSGGTPVPTPISRTPLPPPVTLPGTASHLFPETGKTVRGIFLDYWNKNGGLAQQGYPISELLGEVSDLDGKVYAMQYFERAVFEYHPENAGTPYEVLLSQLGTFQYKQRYPNNAPGQQPNTLQGSVLFPETGKRLGGRFLDYWKSHGGLAQQGYPISDEFMERSDLDGKEYLVQYFERAVFEYHPENAGSPYEVLLSQLGTFRYRSQYP
jgi:carboxypeptidase T